MGGGSGLPESMTRLEYFPAGRRLDGGTGVIAADPYFVRFLVRWHGHEFEVLELNKDTIFLIQDILTFSVGLLTASK